MQFRATIIGFLLGCLGAGLLMLATPAQLEGLSQLFSDPATGKPLFGLDSMALKYGLMALSITLLPLLALALATLINRPSADDVGEVRDLYDPVHRFPTFNQDFAAQPPQEAPATEVPAAPADNILPLPTHAASTSQAPEPHIILENRLFAIAEHIDQLMGITEKNRENIATLMQQVGSIAHAPAPAAAHDIHDALQHITQRLDSLEKAQQPLLERTEKMEQWLSQMVQNSTHASHETAAPSYAPPPMRAVPSMSAPPSLTDPATAERLALALEQLRRVTNGVSNS